MLKSKTRVFLVDDHEMILPGLKIAIESIDKFSVIGTATDGLTAFNSIMELSPDIAVLDLSIPVLNGFEITRKLKEKKSPVKIIILTSYSEDKYIREAMELKVDGYLLKENSSRELIEALDTVAGGLKYITPKVMTKLMNENDPGRKNETGVLAADSLTEKEYEVLKLISEGKRGREICNILNISESTLKTHKSHMMQKLNVASVNELMLYALKNNIFSGNS
jgi:two-component system response regulator NreC